MMEVGCGKTMRPRIATGRREIMLKASPDAG